VYDYTSCEDSVILRCAAGGDVGHVLLWRRYLLVLSRE
jgi:hypothetical protein